MVAGNRMHAAQVASSRSCSALLGPASGNRCPEWGVGGLLGEVADGGRSFVAGKPLPELAKVYRSSRRPQGLAEVEHGERGSAAFLGLVAVE